MSLKQFILFKIIAIPVSLAGVHSRINESMDAEESEDCFDDTSFFRVSKLLHKSLFILNIKQW